MKKLVKTGFDKSNITSFGNMFLLGNGHLGYRGTLEEYSKDECVALNVPGFYDRYQKLWRETINLPNPFHIKVKTNIENCSVLENSPLSHQISLDIEHALFSRQSVFASLIIDSERFVSSVNENLLGLKYCLKAKEDIDVELYVGLDDNIWDINGPHFKNKKYSVTNRGVAFYGLTNERKKISEVVSYKFKGFDITKTETGFILKTHLLKGEKREIIALCRVYENEKHLKHEKLNKKIYLAEKDAHGSGFYQKFHNAKVEIKGDLEAQDELDYSVYHLCILSNKNNNKSVVVADALGTRTYPLASSFDFRQSLVELEKLGNQLFIRLKDRTTPLSSINKNEIVVTINGNISDKLIIQAKGGFVSLNDLTFVNLNKYVTIANRDYNPDTDSFEPWNPKPPRDGGDKKKNNNLVIIIPIVIGSVVLIAAAVVVTILIVRRRKAHA